MKEDQKPYSCHVCSGNLIESPAFNSLKLISSDCKPWYSNSKIFVCEQCGLIQKELTSDWFNTIDQIYNSYTIYSQSDGKEQVIFDELTGENKFRSDIICEWIQRNQPLREDSQILDVGCGTGVTLEAFSKISSTHTLYGLENNSKNLSYLSKICNFEKLFTSVDQINKKFDVITFIHSLEHIPYPSQYLKNISNHLSPEGIIIIQIPNIESSPFDSLIIDHCSHFSLKSIEYCLASAGLEIVISSNSLVKKELSIIARRQHNSSQNTIKDNQTHAYSLKKILDQRAAWLLELQKQALDIKENLGIFGSSISGTWLASIAPHTAFFVEEDKNKIGRSHLGIPIIEVKHIPKNSKVLMPLRYDIAKNIKERLQLPELILPPHYYE